MKTISMRLRGAKTEMAAAGEDTAGMANSVSTLRSEIMALTASTGKPVDIMLNDSTFKETYQQMKELSVAWNSGKMSDINKAALLELIAGKTQSNIAAAMLQNFDQAENALGTSRDSAGSALHENQAVLDSIQGKMTRLDASFQSLSGILVNSDLMKAGLDVANFGMSGITSLSQLASKTPIASLVGLGTAISSIWGAINGTRMGTFTRNDHFDPNKGVFGNVMFRGQDIASLVKSGSVDQSRKGVFDKVWTSIKNRFNADKIAVAEYNKALKDGTFNIDDYVGAQSKLNDAQQDYISTLDGTSASYAGYKRYLNDRVNGFNTEASRMRRATRIAEQYNEAQAKGKDEALDFAAAQKEKTRAVGDFLEGYAKEGKSLKMGESSEDVSKLADSMIGQMAPSGSIIPAGLKSIGATVMSGLMNVGLSMLISSIADWGIKAADYVANYNQKKYDKAAENYQARKSESTEQAKSYDALSSYAKQYQDLMASNSITGSARTEQVLELQSEINSLLLSQGKSVDLLNGQRAQNIQYLKDEVNLQRENAIVAQSITTDAAKEQLTRYQKLRTSGTFSDIWAGKDNKKVISYDTDPRAAEIFAKYGFKLRSDTVDVAGKQLYDGKIQFLNTDNVTPRQWITAYDEVLADKRKRGLQGTEDYARMQRDINEYMAQAGTYFDEQQLQAELMAENALEAKGLNEQLAHGSKLWDEYTQKGKRDISQSDMFKEHTKAAKEALKSDKAFMDYMKKEGFSDDQINSLADKLVRSKSPLAAEAYDQEQAARKARANGYKTSEEYLELEKRFQAYANATAKTSPETSEYFHELSLDNWMNSFEDNTREAENAFKNIFNSAVGDNADPEMTKAVKEMKNAFEKQGSLDEASLRKMMEKDGTGVWGAVLEKLGGTSQLPLLASMLNTWFGSGMTKTGLTTEALAFSSEINAAKNVTSKAGLATSKYATAVQGPENDDDFKVFGEALKVFNEEAKKGRLGSNHMNAAAELLFGKEAMRNADYDIPTMIAKAGPRISRILNNPEDSGLQFLNELMSYYGKEGKVYATDMKTGKADMSKVLGQIYQKDGKWNFDIPDIEKWAAEVARDWGVSQEFILSALQANRNYFPDASFINPEKTARAIHDMSRETAGDMSPEITTLKDGRKVYNQADIAEMVWYQGGTVGDIRDTTDALKAQGDIVVDVRDKGEELAKTLTEAGALIRNGDGSYSKSSTFDDFIKKLGLTRDEALTLQMNLDELCGEDREINIDTNVNKDELEGIEAQAYQGNKKSGEAKNELGTVEAAKLVRVNPAVTDGLDSSTKEMYHDTALNLKLKQHEEYVNQYKPVKFDTAMYDGLEKGIGNYDKAIERAEKYNKIQEQLTEHAKYNNKYSPVNYDSAAFEGLGKSSEYLDNVNKKYKDLVNAQNRANLKAVNYDTAAFDGLDVDFKVDNAINKYKQLAEAQKKIRQEQQPRGSATDLITPVQAAELTPEQVVKQASGETTVKVNADTSEADSKLEGVKTKADEVGTKNPNVNVSASGDTTALDEADSKASTLDGKEVTVEVNTEAKSDSGSLLSNIKDALANLSIDNSANVDLDVDTSSLSTAVSQIQELQSALANITSPDLSGLTSAFAGIPEAVASAKASISEIGASLSKADGTSLSTVINAVGNIGRMAASSTASVTSTQNAVNNLNGASLGSVISQVASLTGIAASAAAMVRSIDAALNALNGKNVTTTVTTKHVTIGGGGNASASTGYGHTESSYATGGTVDALNKGSNFAKGGLTLVGELGPEMVRSGDKSYMVGRFGPELVRLKKGDQVFNHIETKRILATGGLNSPRAVLPAHANGTQGYRFPAMAEVHTPAGGVAIHYIPGGMAAGAAALTNSANKTSQAIKNTAQQTAQAVQNTAQQTAQVVQNTAALSKDAWEEELAKHKWMVATKQETDQQYFDWYSKQINIQKEGGIVTQKDWYGLDTERYNLEMNLIKQQFDLEQAKKDYALEYADINKAQYAQWYEGFENRKNDAGLYTELEWAQAQIKILQQSREIWNQKISDFDHSTNMAQYDVYDKIARLKDKHQWMTDNIKQFWKDGKLSAEQYHSALEQIAELTETIKNEEFSAWESWMDRRDTRYNKLINSDLVGGLGKWNTEIWGAISQGQKELRKLIVEEGAAWDDPRIEAIMNKNRQYEQTVHQRHLQTTKDAQAALESLFNYYKQMRQQDINDQKETLQESYNLFKKNLDDQKKLLRRQKEDDDYLYDQKKKRKSVSDIQMQLQQLSMDNSAQAGKKRIELMQQLNDEQDNLDRFEKDRAYNLAVRFLEDEEDAYADAYEKKTKELSKALDNMGKLYEDFLNEMRDHSNTLFEDLKQWNSEHGSGIEEDIVTAWDEAYSKLKDYADLYGKFMEEIDTGPNGMNNSQGGDKDITGWQYNDSKWILNSTANKELQSTLQSERNDYLKAEEQKKVTSAAASAVNGAISNVSTTINQQPAKKEETVKPKEEPKPELKVGAKIKIKPGTKWYATSWGTGSYGSTDKEMDATIQIVSPYDNSTYPYSINGWGWIRKQDIVGYAKGTKNALAGIAQIDEEGAETIFQSKNGQKYKMFSGGEKVLNAKASNFLYDFANQGSTMFAGFFKSLGEGLKAVVNSTSSPINVSMGDIIVQGSADKATVSEIRRAQRDNLDYMLRNLGKLQATT